MKLGRPTARELVTSEPVWQRTCSLSMWLQFECTHTHARAHAACAAFDRTRQRRNRDTRALCALRTERDPTRRRSLSLSLSFNELPTCASSAAFSLCSYSHTRSLSLIRSVTHSASLWFCCCVINK